MPSKKTWTVHHEDCIEGMRKLPESSVDFSVFSPPFPALYAYTDSECDLGNVDQLGAEVRLHFGYFCRSLLRVIKPGRVVVMHVMNIPRMKRTGGVGLYDFAGLLIRLAERAGFIYEYQWLVRKNPQAQAIRTKSRELQFSGLESDRAKSRGSLPDHLLKFRKPGENATPIDSKYQVSREDWIRWAECCWFDIKETDTLNVRGTKGENDVKHICPLQLEVIRRLILLYSNPGELVLSPFTGIGSEGYVAVKNDRQFVGFELKDEYFRQAKANIASAAKEMARQEELFTA